MSTQPTIHLDVPYYQQHNEYSCFGTCIRMVLAYYGATIDVDALWRKGQIPPHPGGWDITLARPVIELGYQVTSYWNGHYIDAWPVADETKAMYKKLYDTMHDPNYTHQTDATIDVITDYLKQGVPVIAEVTADKFYPCDCDWTHMVVLTGIEGNAFTYHDPYAKRGGAGDRVSIAQFLEAWGQLRPGCGRSLFVITKST